MFKSRYIIRIAKNRIIWDSEESEEEETNSSNRLESKIDINNIE